MSGAGFSSAHEDTVDIKATRKKKNNIFVKDYVIISPSSYCISII
jgi:hypothetical protein